MSQTTTLNDVYNTILDNAFNDIIKEAPDFFPKRDRGTINLGVVYYNLLRQKFEAENPNASAMIKKSFYCHLRNFLHQHGNMVVESLPMVDTIEDHSYTQSRRNNETIKISIFTSDKKRKVLYPDPNVKVVDNNYNNSVMIGRKLTKSGYVNVMTSVNVCE